MTAPIRLVIADDHEIFRDGLALMLSRQKHMILAGQASDGTELLSLVRETTPNVDVVLADIKMPNMDGIEATKVLLKEFPDLRIIALSMFSEENLIVEMLEAGAKGYLLKNADKQEILDAIASVMDNREYYCRDTSATLAGMIVKSNFNPFRKREVVEFSDREMEIIKLICRQFTAQEMGESLFLSRRTVEGYRTRILEKMNVKNTAGVVIYALKNKLISEKELL
ncbi:response regulator transcription factor [Dinghuibacter silviterrae]|uniref:LuxR family two component transcriptional regulator n=1 Tax=Dinghuibacter silviterrae TaxID=1539049 RepID=A0A4R8DPK5_9BACT|nr:response regulator transcription factor [Dinghuibacter silviterrae]TDX00024.1 LuxR family two component transcriptional regulator [Dinghuibacter silviterrae]